MTSVKVLKLSNGEEIVSEVNPLLNGVLSLKNPIAIAYFPDQNTGEMKPTLLPYAQHVEGDTIEIDSAHIVYKGNANAGLTEAYKRATSKIVAPPQGLVVPGGRK